MDYLTVKEVAELKGCSFQYVCKLINENKLDAVQEINKFNNKPQYLIPVSALPLDLQEKYYKKIMDDAGLAPELKESKTVKKQHKNTAKRSFEEYSEEERQEIALWCDIIQDWQQHRAAFTKKTEFDKLYIGKAQIEHPNINISANILYRKYAAYRNRDYDGLIDKRGGWNKNKSSIPGIVFEGFLNYYLQDNQPTVSQCYKDVIWWTNEFFPELSANFPSENTFRRHIKSDVARAIRDYKLEGEKVLKDRNLPYVMRLYDKLNANDVWIADNNTLDIQSTDENGNTHRLYVTAFLDAKSSVLVGWNITENPSAQSTILALRHAIMRFGIPEKVLFDNGTEFLAYDVGGRAGRKQKRKQENNIVITPPGVLKRLGIEMRNAEVMNARAKPIERTFLTSKNQYSRAHSGFCGGNILEKPVSLKRRIKEGKLPCDYEIRESYQLWADYNYNVQAYGGNEIKYKGKSRIEVWNESIAQVGIRKTTEDMLNLMLMRSSDYQKINRNGVWITIAKEKIWYLNTEQAVMNQGKEVYVRYDPADLRSARIYDKDDRYLWTWNCADILMVDFITQNKQEVADPQTLIRSTMKFVKQQAENLTANLTNEQRLSAYDTMIRRAYANKDKFSIQQPSKIIPIMVGEEETDLKNASGYDVISVDIDLKRIQRNAEKRKE